MCLLCTFSARRRPLAVASLVGFQSTTLQGQLHRSYTHSSSIDVFLCVSGYGFDQCACEVVSCLPFDLRSASFAQQPNEFCFGGCGVCGRHHAHRLAGRAVPARARVLHGVVEEGVGSLVRVRGLVQATRSFESIKFQQTLWLQACPCLRVRSLVNVF